ncbi:MAG: zf-TFIIB domain-containing protein [Proteobacteria bacterium]|nr:zf-TFIIB domain-containing protein [Pseudomonadota bacterium]
MMVCPKCEASLLHERERGDLVLDVCRECGGIWLDGRELDQIVARAAEAGAQKERRRKRPAPDRDYYDDDDGVRGSALFHLATSPHTNGVFLSVKQAKKLAKKHRRKARERRHRRKKKGSLYDLIGDVLG